LRIGDKLNTEPEIVFDGGTPEAEVEQNLLKQLRMLAAR
jgi:hypothetical protein